jgi:hypothetical protein
MRLPLHARELGEEHTARANLDIVTRGKPQHHAARSLPELRLQICQRSRLGVEKCDPGRLRQGVVLVLLIYWTEDCTRLAQVNRWLTASQTAWTSCSSRIVRYWIMLMFTNDNSGMQQLDRKCW